MDVFLNMLPGILLLIVGFGLVVFEMYIPGFGIPGIIGIILLALGVYFTVSTPMQALLLVLGIIVLLCICLVISLRSAARGRLAKSKLVLNEVATQKDEEENSTAALIGRCGVTKTVLRPSGMAEFDGEKFNVVSDGEFIAIGQKVIVESVEGNRIVVREYNG